MKRTINIDALARVEGEGALTIRFRDGEIRNDELRLFEPPRFFEAFLRGRSYLEVPDLTARICGICPVAYQMSSCRAMEDALGLDVGEEIRRLRRLFYCGEWIESHALHVFLLHAPDFLGYPDAFTMAKQHTELVRSGLRIKKAGNALLRVIGGREIHPINPRVGGFHRAPSRTELAALLPALRSARDDAEEAITAFARFPFPDVERDWEVVSLVDSTEYPILSGRVVSSRGLDLAVRDFDEHFVEHQVPYSNALHSTIRGRGAYLCGPLARFNLAFERLGARARSAVSVAGLVAPCRNPFRSILVRMVEIIQVLDEAVALIESYVPPAPPFVTAEVRAATGCGATEAPRGLLYHRYTIDDDGLIREARIVPPTSQNQKSIEEDLFALAPLLLEKPPKEATRLAEQAVRNHDPCISCATHFLELRFEDDGGPSCRRE